MNKFSEAKEYIGAIIAGNLKNRIIFNNKDFFFEIESRFFDFIEIFFDWIF
jgi:hypothetical protein